MESDSESEYDSDSSSSEQSEKSKKYRLSVVQRAALEQLDEVLNSENGDIDTLDKAFHMAIRALFCWHEPRRLLSDMDCPIQRFLVVLCLRKEGEGFINVRDITSLIAKLLYCIRATVFMELIQRNERKGGDMNIDQTLDGTGMYIKDLVQSPFGFLRETMHLAAAIPIRSALEPPNRGLLTLFRWRKISPI